MSNTANREEFSEWFFFENMKTILVYSSRIESTRVHSIQKVNNLEFYRPAWANDMDEMMHENWGQ